jgi:hypothetical protein
MDLMINILAIILFFAFPITVSLIITGAFRDDKPNKDNIRTSLCLGNPKIKILEITKDGRTYYEAYDKLFFIKYKIAEAYSLDELEELIFEYKADFERRRHDGKKWLSEKEIFERRL